jgi:hypothetical protein
MTTKGSNITKANIVAQIKTLASYNNSIVWGSDNNPFSQSNPTGGTTSGYAYGNVETIDDNAVLANTIGANFRAYANLLSRIRQVRLLKWYQVQGEPRNNLDYDVTNLTNLNSDYGTPMDSIAAPQIGDNISADALDSFVAALSNQVNSTRVSTVTVEEFYCHSNCHGSCHGSI